MPKLPSPATYKTWDAEHAAKGNAASVASRLNLEWPNDPRRNAVLSQRPKLCWCGVKRYRQYTVCWSHWKERKKGRHEASKNPRCPNCKTRFAKVKYEGMCAECFTLGHRAYFKKTHVAEKPDTPIGPGSGKHSREYPTALEGLRPGEMTRCPKCHEPMVRRRLWRHRCGE